MIVQNEMFSGMPPEAQDKVNLIAIRKPYLTFLLYFDRNGWVSELAEHSHLMRDVRGVKHDSKG